MQPAKQHLPSCLRMVISVSHRIPLHPWARLGIAHQACRGYESGVVTTLGLVAHKALYSLPRISAGAFRQASWTSLVSTAVCMQRTSLSSMLVMPGLLRGQEGHRELISLINKYKYCSMQLIQVGT